MLIKKEQLTQESVKVYSKKQQNILARSLGVAAIGFLLVVAIGYGLYYGILKGNISYDTYNILAGVGISLSFILMLTLLWAKPSIGLYVGLLISYTVSAGVGFTSLFARFDMPELMIIFGLAGSVFGITAILGFILPQKAIATITKFSFYSFFLAAILSLVFIFVGVFTPLGSGWQWYTYLIIVLTTFFAVGYNIYLFYTISKLQEFHNENEDIKQTHLLVLMLGFNILVSFIQLIWRIAYILAEVKS